MVAKSVSSPIYRDVLKKAKEYYMKSSCYHCFTNLSQDKYLGIALTFYEQQTGQTMSVEKRSGPRLHSN